MSDNSLNHNHDEKKSFADLLESYSSGMSEDIRVGDKIRGEIISIGKDRVYIDTGTKIDGFVEKSELLDDAGEFSCKTGEFLELYVVSFNGDEIALSKAISGVGGLRMLEDAVENAVPVEGKVKEKVKGGFHVEVAQRRAFCPISQMDLRYVENPEAYIGNTYRFLITRLEENGRNIVVSRRDLLEKEQKEERTKFLQAIQVGDQVQGRVTKVMPYGAFVEIFPGLEGMVHVSEISWSRVSKPEEVVRVDETILVTITDIKPSDKNGQPRISLSIKQVTGDPWERIPEEFHEGDRVKGKVTRCMGFGAFVEIAPGVEGLVHISEMSYTKRVLKPEEIVQVGETVSVLIKEIDLGNRRISLSIKDVEGDPWIGIEKRYSVGLPVEGILEKRERFGIFVRLEPGVTGLLPQSKMKESQDLSSMEKAKPGDPLKVIIAEIHSEQRKITLSPAEMKEEDEWQRFSTSKEISFGSLGEKLQQALKNKKE